MTRATSRPNSVGSVALASVVFSSLLCYAQAPVTERDSVERARFASNELAISADGTRLAYVVVRPDAAANQNRWSIVVRDLAAAKMTSANGRTLFEMSSPALSSNVITGNVNIPISSVKWVQGDKFLLFKQQPRFNDDAGNICLLDTRSGAVRVVYSFPGAIGEVSAAADGQTVALYLIFPQDDGRKRQMDENGFAVDKMLFANQQHTRLWQNPVRKIVVIQNLQSGHPVTNVVEEYRDQLVRTSPYTPHLSLSPSGEYLLYTREAPDLRKSWKSAREYQDTDSHARSFSRPYDFGLNRELTFYNVRTETKQLAFDHPNVVFESVAWSDDSRWFAVRGPRPLSVTDTASPDTAGRAAKNLYAVRVSDLAPVLVARAGESPFDKDPYNFRTLGAVLAWRDAAKTIIVRVGIKGVQVLRFDDNQWKMSPPLELRMPDAPYWFGELRVGATGVVGLLENSSTPPDLYYWPNNAEQSEPERLTKVNPQLDRLRFGPVEKVSWKNKYGASCFGYLILPPDYDPSKKYPAVLMVKDWSDMFIMDGQWYQTTFPVQALANDGMIVLLAAAPSADREPDIGPGRMGYNFNEMAMVESAIEMLDKRHLIDSSRIGIAGFSVTSWQTQFILTHSKFLFAAASTADAWNLNYISYATQNLHGSPQGYDMGYTFDHLYGGPPFGRTLKNWLEHAPAFNTDKVRAPVLTEVCGVSSLPVALEWFTALHKLGKPVELYLYPDGQHMLQTPKERLASLRLNVDWFRFWLQGYEGQAPEYDPDRFVRWGNLREQQQKNERAIVAGKDPVEEYQGKLRKEGWLPDD